jgi:hypothetical protein
MTDSAPHTQQKDSRVHFNIEEAQGELYARWARPDPVSSEQRIFDSITSMFVFAAALAYSRSARRKIKGKVRDVFRWANLDETNQALLRSIAMTAPDGGIEVLEDRGRVAEIVEEYVAAGVDILVAELGEDPNRERALEALTRLACEMAAE